MPETQPLRWLHKFADLGWFGVHLFFVISGYCLAERAARSLSRGEGVPSFGSSLFSMGKAAEGLKAVEVDTNKEG
jgi:peptidoglycan/LPS O-acetylase OafA/YrhL